MLGETPLARALTLPAVLCLVVFSPLAEVFAQETAEFKTAVRPFLKTYCAKCHGEKQQKGDRRFDVLDGNITGDNALADYQDILDQLNLSEMPPPEERQPSTEQRRAVIAWLTDAIGRYHASRKQTDAGPVLRRLNAREYRNTIRDLLKLNMTMFDPTAGFPRDQTSEHLDNVGETLVTSGHLLAKYLEAADQSVEKALYPLRRPQVRTWVFRDGFRQQPEIDQVHGRTNRFEHMTLYDVPGADKPEGAYGPILAFREGVPQDGYYEIRLQAEALNRQHPYDIGFVGTDPNEPLRLGIVAGRDDVGDLHKPQPVEPRLAELELADERKWYTVRVWLDAGYTPRFIFPNGLMDVRNMWGRLVRRYADQFSELKSKRPGIVEARFNAIKYGKLPQIHIHEIHIRGPLFDEWPRPGQRVLLGDDTESILQSGELSDSQMRKRLEQFAARAYRRPPVREEVDRVLEVVRARQGQGRTKLEAFSDGIRTILCSPAFLYHNSPQASEKKLSSLAAASRLSYFLWASMPDQQLLDAARGPGLHTAEARVQHAKRMLGDARSDAFVRGFLDSWLTLRDLGATPPDRRDFSAYYRYDLGTAMKRETFLFTRHLLDENLSVMNFLDADFTFANKPLARLYGLDADAAAAVPGGGRFERIQLHDDRRGGLLGQASVLTVTANGVDTSPVVRGVWLLENLLGTPPSPPPPDVEPLDPDVRGAKTIRDQLQKHRSVPSCYDCHRRIDPLGFALENFDPIGQWRDSYGRRTAIDASGELPDGSRFRDVVGLKRLLVAQETQFTRALTEKLLAYATGRHITAADRPQVDAIIDEHARRGSGLRDLILLVVGSDAFLK